MTSRHNARDAVSLAEQAIDHERDAAACREGAEAAVRWYRGKVKVRKLAKRSGLSASTVSILLNGRERSPVSLRSLRLLAQQIPSCLKADE